MTSTPFNVGLGDSARMSSRVLRPPGGGHTDIFGGEPEPVRGRRPVASIIAQSQEPAKPTNGTAINEASEPPPTPNGQEAPQQEQNIPESAQEPKESPKTESAKIESPKAEQPRVVEPPKRVRVPPGGFSSGLW